MINLVQNDTGPDLTVTLFDAVSNSPIDFSGGSDVVRLYFKKEDGSGALTTIGGSKPNGGSDGVASFVWPNGSLASAGNYEGEIEITFTSGKKQTAPDKLRFFVRGEIA